MVCMDPYQVVEDKEEDIEMKIGIITLPLHGNYGGILQAYALMTVLEDMGHHAEIIDRKDKLVLPSGWKMPLVYVKRALMNLLSSGKGPEVFRERRVIREMPVVNANLLKFMSSRMSCRMLGSYGEIAEGDYEALVVGSDQVWRPKYFGKIEDAFLDFARDWDIRRVAYAASFGTDELEYTYQQLEVCSQLLSRFDAVSVRESGAVSLCDEWFDREDVLHVLDPVMLLPPEEYVSIAQTSESRPAAGKALIYVLDPAKEKDAVTERARKWFRGEVHDASVFPRDPSVPLHKRIIPPMEEWLSCFVDSEFVVTDSFHGCVLSILLHKPFIVLGNPHRGMGRILSILETFGLEDRLVHGLDPDDDGEYYMENPDWEAVDKVLSEWRTKSLAFLKNVL